MATKSAMFLLIFIPSLAFANATQEDLLDVIAGINIRSDGGILVPRQWEWEQDFVSSTTWLYALTNDEPVNYQYYEFPMAEIKASISFIIYIKYNLILSAVPVSLILPPETVWTPQYRTTLEAAGFITKKGIVLGDTRDDVHASYGTPMRDPGKVNGYFDELFQYVNDDLLSVRAGFDVGSADSHFAADLWDIDYYPDHGLAFQYASEESQNFLDRVTRIYVFVPPSITSVLPWTWSQVKEAF